MIEERFELHEERLDHYGERIEALEGAKQRRHSHALEWIVIGLIGVEIALQIFRHG